VNLLEMAALEQVEVGDWHLSLEPWYALLLSLLAPRFVEASRDGWLQFEHGAEREIVFESLSPEQENYLHEFIETFSTHPVLGASPQVLRHLPDGPDFALALGFERNRSGRLSSLAGVLRDCRQGLSEARSQLVGLMTDMCRWIPWRDHGQRGLITCVPVRDEGSNHRANLMAEELAEYMGSGFCNVQVCVHGLGQHGEDEQEYIRQWQRVRREKELHLSDSVDGTRVLVVTESCRHSVGLWGLAGCLRDLGASEVMALACLKTGGEY